MRLFSVPAYSFHRSGSYTTISLQEAVIKVILFHEEKQRLTRVRFGLETASGWKCYRNTMLQCSLAVVQGIALFNFCSICINIRSSTCRLVTLIQRLVFSLLLKQALRFEVMVNPRNTTHRTAAVFQPVHIQDSSDLTGSHFKSPKAIRFHTLLGTM